MVYYTIYSFVRDFWNINTIMQIHAIQDLSNNYVISLLKSNLSKIVDPNIISNYHPDFSNTPGNLFYILNEGRYKIGNYFVLEEDSQYLGSSGWNEYATGTALIMTRTFIPPSYCGSRLISKQVTLPIMFKETTLYNKLWITCNSHNKAIYDMIERANHGVFSGIGSIGRDLYSQFSPIGTKIMVSRLNTGKVTIAGSVGVTIHSAGGKYDLTAQYSVATLLKRDTDTWYLYGDLMV